jgi:hypothetical protein
MAATYDVQIRSVPADRAAEHAVPLSEVVLRHHRADGIQFAEERGIRLTEVRVAAAGGFEGEEPTVSTGVTYQVSVSGEASEEELRELVSEVERTASIPDVLRQETAVLLSDVKVQATH